MKAPICTSTCAATTAAVKRASVMAGGWRVCREGPLTPTLSPRSEEREKRVGGEDVLDYSAPPLRPAMAPRRSRSAFSLMKPWASNWS